MCPLALPRTPPSVLIIIRRGEDRDQCTIQPLRGTPGIDFLRYPLRRKPDVSHHLLLAPEAPPLTPADAGRPLLLLDANWRHAARMRKAIEPVEALFAAFCILGHRDDGLLRLYPWRDDFLALNRDLVEQQERKN